MLSIGVGEIQKNTSIFSNISEPLQVVDKRKKEVLAMIYPIKKHSIVDKLAGKYKTKVAPTKLSMSEIKQIAMMEAWVLSEVLMESFLVLSKFYKLPKKEIIADLKTIVCLEGVVNKDKGILLEALNIIEAKNIDFIDALICAKCKLQNYDKLSFDSDLNDC